MGYWQYWPYRLTFWTPIWVSKLTISIGRPQQLSASAQHICTKPWTSMWLFRSQSICVLQCVTGRYVNIAYYSFGQCLPRSRYSIYHHYPWNVVLYSLIVFKRSTLGINHYERLCYNTAHPSLLSWHEILTSATSSKGELNDFFSKLKLMEFLSKAVTWRLDVEYTRADNNLCR